jgi:hypothetical protein
MYRVWLLLLILAGSLLFVPSCARDQELVSIQIQPAVQTFGASNIPVSADAGLNVQLRALGTFIHPPVTKDITNQVVWSSNTPGIATVSSTGLLTATGVDCGGTIVSATVTTNRSAGGVNSGGALVTASMTANVVCFTGTGGGGGGTPISLTVSFAGAGTGTVSSTPPGLTCSNPGPCSASFPTGTAIALTATPAGGSAFGMWNGCNTMSGVTCTIILNNPTSVSVTFN